MVAFTDPSGATVRNTYDAQSRVIRQQDPLGGNITFDYKGDSNAGTTTITDAEGQLTIEEFTNSTLRRRTVGAGTTAARTTTYEVDGGTLATTAATDVLGRRTSYTYNARGDLSNIQLPDGAVSTASYDAAGNLIALVDALGNRTELDYDAAGRLTARRLPTAAGPALTMLERSGANPTQITASVDPLGRRTTFSYDDNGIVTAVRLPSGATERYVTNDAGDITQVTTAAGRTQKSTHDAAGRVLVATTASGRRTTSAYDAAGRLVAQTDPSGDRTSYRRDAAGRVTAVTDATGRTRRNAYDRSGRLTSASDFSGRTTYYSYDGAGQVVRESSPLGTTTYTYDAAGQVTSTTDAVGAVTRYTYDAAGRTVHVTYSDGTPSVSFAYDLAGRRIRTDDGTGTSTSTYEPSGRLLSAVDGSGQRVGYSYDAAGQLTELTYPSGAKVQRAYNNDGLMTRVTDPRGQSFTFTYDPDGVMTGRSAPDGTSTRITHDADGAVANSTVSRGIVQLLSLAYDRDADGLLSSETSIGVVTAGLRNYQHDAAGRISAAGLGSTVGSTNYSYGPTDLITATTGPDDQHTQLTYDNAGLLRALTRSAAGTPDVTTTYTNDAAGRRTGSQAGELQETFTWSAAGTLSSYRGPRGGSATTVEPAVLSGVTTSPPGSATSPVTTTYAYDGRGLRTSRESGDRTTKFAYDTSTPVPQLLVAGDLQFIHGPGGEVLEQLATDGTSLTLHTDQLGSTRLVTDSTGNAVQTYEYTAYGTLSVTSGSFAEPVTPVLWTGGLRDAESGLYYLYARYYDAASAQFLSADPLTALSHTAHAYAFGSPLTLIDPLGLFGFNPNVLSAVLGGVSAVTGIAAVFATATVFGAPAGAVLGGISITTGVAGALIDCSAGVRSAQCGISGASAALGIVGAGVKTASALGRVSKTFASDFNNFTSIQAGHLGFVGTASSVAGFFGNGGSRPGPSGSPTGTGPGSGGGGTSPSSPLYDPSDPCFS